MTDNSIGARKTSLYDVSLAVTVVAGLASIVSIAAIVIITRGPHVSAGRTLLIAAPTGGAIAFTIFVVGLVTIYRQKKSMNSKPLEVKPPRRTPSPRVAAAVREPPPLAATPPPAAPEELPPVAPTPAAQEQELPPVAATPPPAVPEELPPVAPPPPAAPEELPPVAPPPPAAPEELPPVAPTPAAQEQELPPVAATPLPAAPEELPPVAPTQPPVIQEVLPTPIPTPPPVIQEELPPQPAATAAAQVTNLSPTQEFTAIMLPPRIQDFERFLQALLTPAGINDEVIRTLVENIHNALLNDYIPLLTNGTVTIDQAISELDAILGVGSNILINEMGSMTLWVLSFLSDDKIRMGGPTEMAEKINKHLKGSLAKRQSTINLMLSPEFTAPIIEVAIKLIRTKNQKAWLKLFADAGQAIKKDKSKTPLSNAAAFIADGVKERELAF